MTARVVKANELNRVLDVLQARGIVPVTYELVPGGPVRLHAVVPVGSPDPSQDLKAMEAQWEEALK